MSAHDWASKQNRTTDVLSETQLAFRDMMLRDGTLKGLTSCGFEYCSPIQTRAIPLGRSGLDLLVQAKSGTGKTLVFAIVILEAYKSKIQSPQSLVLAPTREIAVQIEDTIRDLTKGSKGFKVGSFIGGMDVNEDRQKIQECSAIIGTPGRILHLMKNNVLNTTNIRLFVLDEADKLMSDSFRQDVLAIGHRLQQKTQILAVSATFDGGIDRQLAKMMQHPIGVTAKREVPILLGVKQFGYVLPPPPEPPINGKMNSMQEMFAKIKALNGIFEKVPFKQCLIFLNSNQRAESYCNYLSQSGWSTDVMMSRLDQAQRLHTFKRFKNYESRILVCTDLMARGVDSENVNLVVNLDVPINSTTYLHRIGRAGRFGTHGMAITLMTDADELQRMRVLLGTLGGSKSFVLKFPMNAAGNEVDIWEYDTVDVREKYFGVEPAMSSARAEQEAMRTMRGRGRAEKRKGESSTSPLLPTPKPPAGCQSSTDQAEPIVTAVTQEIDCKSVQEPEASLPAKLAFADLLNQLTSDINTCQIQQPNNNSVGDIQTSIVEENQKMLSAARWLVDGPPKSADFTLNLPLDLFGVNTLGISFAQADVVAEIPSTNLLQPNTVEDVQSAGTIEATALEEEIVTSTTVVDTNAKETEKIKFLQPSLNKKTDDSADANMSFDRIMCELEDLTGQTQNTPQDLLAANQYLFSDVVTEKPTSVSFDADLFANCGAAQVDPQPSTASDLNVTAAEFVPIVRSLKDANLQPAIDAPLIGSTDMTSESGCAENQTVIENSHTAVGPTESADNSCANTLDSYRPYITASNIQECPWISVKPNSQQNPFQLHQPNQLVSVAGEEEVNEGQVDDDVEDESDDGYIEEEQEGDDMEDSTTATEVSTDNGDFNTETGAATDMDEHIAAAGVQKYFSDGFHPAAHVSVRGRNKEAQQNWDRLYRRQLQQIQCYVQFAKDFNKQMDQK